jgi:hypothetical protein
MARPAAFRFTKTASSPVLKRNREPLRLFEIARVLVRLDHVAGIIANANHSII